MGAFGLRDVSDAKEETLAQWDARFSLIFDEYETHPQRIRPLQASMEERLLRAFAGLINQLRQNDLGIDRYIWRSRDDAKVRGSHAEYDDQVFRWDTAPADGHPGHAFNCRCYAEPVNPAVPNAATLVQVSPAIDAPLEAIFRQLGIRATALTPLGAAVLTALAGSALLQQFMTQAATTQRLQSAAERLGVDIGTAEGLMAAMAHELVQESVITGLGTSLPKTIEAAQIAAQAAAFFEMLNPGTMLNVSKGDADAQAALWQFVQNAYDAFAGGRLRLADGKIADGWVEVFPELTNGERRLGQLPGFTPQRLEEWLETYPAEVLGLPIHTGSPIPANPSGNIISTPIPQEVGPNIVEARPDGRFKTPGGNTVGNHGGKGDGLEYITGKGHTPEQIDDIIANPRLDLSGKVAGRGEYKGQEMTLLTGQDGQWVLLNPEGRVTAVSDRNRPLRDNENEPDPIIRPLE